MTWLIILLADAGLILLLARALPQIEIESYGKAVLAALLISICNATLGYVLNNILDFLTLGLFTSIISLVITAVMVKLVDAAMRSFNVRGFWPALVIGLVIGIANFLIVQAF